MESIKERIIIAHRGASGLFPENTLLSFREALKLGAHMIELDVHETLDGELVCIHDSTVDRTTNGTGKIHKLTYKELLDFDAGEGERIPLLDDVLKYASGKLAVNIELKVIGIEQKVLSIAEQNGMLKDIMISSFYHGSLVTVRDLNETTVTAVLVEKSIDDIVNYSLELKANAINPDHKLVSLDLVQEIHNCGLKVYPWTVNNPITMTRLFASGVDGIITNFPGKALEILKLQT